MPSPAAVSLADMASSGVRLRPTDAATIAHALIRMAASGAIRGIPSPLVIKLTPSGSLEVEGPVAAGGDPVRQAGALLAALLGANGQARSGTLAAIAARAQLAPGEAYPSLEAMAGALVPFAARDAVSALRELYAAWSATKSGGGKPTAATDAGLPRPLTIADIRRARRATGLSLTEISRRSRIPVDLLRQLEWGYLRNWPPGIYGRVQMTRYARAAGLDEAVVHHALRPIVAEAQRAAAAPAAAAAGARPLLVDAAVGRGELLFGEEDEGASSIAAVAVRPDEVADDRAVTGRRSALWPAAAAVLALGLSAAAGFLAVRSVDRVRQPAAVTAGPPPPAPSNIHLRAPADENGVVPAERAFAPPVLPPARVSASRRRPAAPPFEVRSSGAAPATPEAVAAPAAATLSGVRLLQVSDAGRPIDATTTVDGTRLAFASPRGGVSGIYVAEVAGEGARQVRRISGPLPAADPAWSRDGARLAFVRAEPDGADVWNVWTIPAAGGDPRRVTAHPSGHARTPAWLADNRTLIYALDDALMLLDTESGEERRLAIGGVEGTVSDPAVSPDGRRVAFAVAGDGGWLLDFAAGIPRKIISDRTARHFMWSDDGRRLAYQSGDGDWNLWVMAAR